MDDTELDVTGNSYRNIILLTFVAPSQPQTYIMLSTCAIQLLVIIVMVVVHERMIGCSEFDEAAGVKNERGSLYRQSDRLKQGMAQCLLGIEPVTRQ